MKTTRRHWSIALAAAVTLLAAPALADTTHYYPGPGDDWQRRTPAQSGLSGDALNTAVAFAIERTSTRPRDQALASALGFAREPYNEILGPTKPRGEGTGLIVHRGYIVAEWGDPHRVDMTHSVTKSLLSTVVAVAYDRGRIRQLDDRVAQYVSGDWFASDHNAPITWDHLLRQTSNWVGTLWDKPHWADRPVGDDPFAWPTLPVPAPGTAWKYNDVRVNLLALAALHVWRRPLPEVLREHVMDPIGASGTWSWHGYRNAWVEIDGRRVQSVSGGGHWGGGVFINAYDQARFGYLTLRRGVWDGRRIFSEDWYRRATTPTPANPGYGVMNWFLNTRGELLPSAPATAFAHLGAGTNMVYVDPDNELVVVARWIERDALDGLIERVLRALESP